MEMTGALAPNTVLNGAEKLFEGKIKGPEGLATANGTLYTSTRGGDIIKIVGDKMVPIANIGHKCGMLIYKYYDKVFKFLNSDFSIIFIIIIIVYCQSKIINYQLILPAF